jgi:hypothetical protein
MNSLVVCAHKASTKPRGNSFRVLIYVGITVESLHISYDNVFSKLIFMPLPNVRLKLAFPFLSKFDNFRCI